MNIADPWERRRPLASNRRRRRGEYSIIPVTEEAPQIEEGEEDDELKKLIAPFLNDLTDISLLWSFKPHVAADIWNDDVSFLF